MVDPCKVGKAYRLEARNPYVDTAWNVVVTQTTMDSAKARGPGAVQELMWNVPHTLMRPLAVFRGVREIGRIRGCVMLASHYYDALGSSIAAPGK